MNTIQCPLCKEFFDPGEAVVHGLEQKNQEILQKAREGIELKAKEKAKKEFELEAADSKKELEEYRKNQEELRKKVLEANEQTRLLKRKEEEREIEMQKWRMKESENLSEELTKKIQEKADLEKRELQIQLESLKKALEEANKKGSSKSQQLQGEALEEEVLKLLKTFPDEIIEIGKGVSGADIRQIVKSPKGYPCGSILWECKRAEWHERFVEKLRLDQRSEHANLAVIVTINPPKDATDGFVNRGDDIWICSLSLIVPLAVALRKMLLDAAFQKALAVNRGEKKEDLFSYITSNEFVQPVKTIVEVYKEMDMQITKEEDAYKKIWKQRRSQAQRIISSMATIVGSIQGKIGASALQIQELELIESGDEDKNSPHV